MFNFENIKINSHYLNVLFVTALVLFLSMFTLTCHFKSPQPPTWKPQVTIPLIDKSYTITELAKDDNIVADSTGLLEYITEQNISKKELGNRLNVGPFEKEKDLTINEIHIPYLFSEWIEYSLNSIYPKAEEEHGHETVVAPFEILPTRQDFAEIPVFQWLLIKEGLLSVKVENELAITLGTPFRVKLINNLDNTVIGEVTFDEKIQSGHSAEQIIQLQQKVITNHIRAIVYGNSAGTEEQSKKIDKNSTFKITITFSNIIALELMAQIPEYQYTYKDSMSLSDSLLIREAVFKDGDFEYTFRNDFDVLVHVILELPNIFKPNGSTFIDTLEIIPKQTLTRKISLQQYKFKAIEQEEIENLKINVTVKLATNMNNTVTIRSIDAVVSDVRFSKIVFSSLTGRLYRIPLPIPPTLKFLNLPSEVDSVRLAGAYLTFHLTYSIGFIMNTDLTLTAINDQGDSVSIHLDRTLSAVLPDEEFKSVEIRLLNVAPLFNIIPTQLKLKGRILIGEKKKVNTITELDYVSGDIQLIIPLQLILPSQQVNSEIRTVNLSEDMQDLLEEWIVSGFVAIKTINHLPFAPSIKILISNDEDSVYNSTDLQLGPIKIGRAKTDSLSGKVIAPVEEKSEIILQEEDLSLFTHSPVFVGLEIQWPGTLGRYIAVYADDYIYINALSFISVKAEFDD